jgi:hypothetical protein
MNDEIKFPEMRLELLEHIQALSDAEYQKRAWAEGDETTGHDELDYAIHFFYDDTDLALNPHSSIGYILKNEVEAESVKCLMKSIEDIFQKFGRSLSDAEYISLPEWGNVLSAAKKSSVSFLCGNSVKTNQFTCSEKHVSECLLNIIFKMREGAPASMPNISARIMIDLPEIAYKNRLTAILFGLMG